MGIERGSAERPGGRLAATTHVSRVDASRKAQPPRCVPLGMHVLVRTCSSAGKQLEGAPAVVATIIEERPSRGHLGDYGLGASLREQPQGAAIANRCWHVRRHDHEHRDARSGSQPFCEKCRTPRHATRVEGVPGHRVAGAPRRTPSHRHTPAPALCTIAVTAAPESANPASKSGST